jgi:hypothetical protein
MTWSMAVSPRQMRYKISLNEKDQWSEIGESSTDGKRWEQFFAMTLNKTADTKAEPR